MVIHLETSANDLLIAYSAADATATASSFAILKPKMVHLSDASLLTPL